MTPQEMTMLCRLRTARERNAAADLAEARAMVDRAHYAAALARQTLADHDRHLAETIAAFHDRTSASPITPGALTDARTFHADLVSHRFGLLASIEQADDLVKAAEDATVPIRQTWQRARGALDRAEETRDRLRREAARAAAQREESEVEEITLARRMRAERMPA